ncbi:MAG: hypothetical protein AAF602_21080 [Myxococcota bacterium]
MRLVGLAVLLTACSGSGSDVPNPGTDTGEPPLFFTFKSQVPVTGLGAEISEAAVRAHQASNLLLSSQRLLAADEKVQDELRSFGGDGDVPRSAFQCWTRPQFPRWTFTLAFGDACGEFDIEGAAGIERHPTQQLLYNFQNFNIQGREMSGTLALNTRDRATNVPFAFVLYDTELDDPGLDARTEIGVTLGPGIRSGITFDGGAAVSFTNQAWSVWGTSQISGSDDEITVVHGARTVDGVAPDSPTGADVLRSSLDWLECRCPTSGLTSQEMPLVITEVTVDIDDLEEEPDEVDDPPLTIPVEAQVDGRGILNHIGCGEYEVEYEADALQITLDKQLVFAELQFVCDTRTINDPERCTAFQQALLRNSEDLVVDVSVEDLLATAQESVLLQFDTNWCNY